MTRSPRTSIRCVVFDATGTVMQPDPPVADAYWNVAREFGSQLSVADIKIRFHKAFAGHFNLNANDSNQFDPSVETQIVDDEDDRARWYRVVVDTIDDVADSDRQVVFERLWHHFALPESWRVYADVEPTLVELKRLGILVAIGSNFDSRIAQVVGGHRPLETVDHCFWSTQLRAAKPNVAFFDRIADRLGIPGKELLMVGDDRVNDFQAARIAGWDAILIDRSARHDLARNDLIVDLRQCIAHCRL